MSYSPNDMAHFQTTQWSLICGFHSYVRFDFVIRHVVTAISRRDSILLCDCNCKCEILIFLRRDSAIVTFPLFSWDRTDLRASPGRTDGDAASFCAYIRLINIIRAPCTTKSRQHFRESMTLLCKTRTHTQCLLGILFSRVGSWLVISHAVFCFQESSNSVTLYHSKTRFLCFLKPSSPS